MVDTTHHRAEGPTLAVERGGRHEDQVEEVDEVSQTQPEHVDIGDRPQVPGGGDLPGGTRGGLRLGDYHGDDDEVEEAEADEQQVDDGEGDAQRLRPVTHCCILEYRQSEGQ